MSNHIHNTMALALNNFQRKQMRNVGLVIIVAIFTFVLFSASLLIRNIQNGLTITAKRMGADLMIVPEGYEADFEGVLLKSEPSTFYLHSDVEATVNSIEGVERCSSQLFLESLDADCCSVPVQMIAFDIDKDITITPWLEESYQGDLKPGEIIIGYLVEAVVNDKLIFYGQEFTVVARMAETGTGLDASIYMTRETAYNMCGHSAAVDAQEMDGAATLSSCVMVQAAPDVDLQELAEHISASIDGIDIIVTENLIGSMTEQLDTMARILYIVIVLLWVVAVIVLLTIFNVMINERRGEFGLYRALGFSRKKLKRLILCEGLIISVAGAAIGIILGSLIIFPFRDLIASSLKLPYLNSSIGTIVTYIALGFFVSVITVLAVCFFDAKKIGKSETFLLMRERL